MTIHSEGENSTEHPIVRETRIKRPGSKRQFLNTLFFIGTITLIGGVAYLLFIPKKETYTLKSYKYATVRKANITNSIQVAGILTVLKKQTILAPQSGIIKTIEVSEGDSVKKGQFLANIYSQELEDNLNEAMTNLTKKTRSRNNQILQQKHKEEQYIRTLKKLTEQSQRAFKSYQRYKKLYDAGAATKKELETALSKWKNSQEAINEYKIEREEELSYYNFTIKNLETDISTLREKISSIKTQIKECKIFSPITGEVIDIYQTPGKYISRFSKIMTIADLSKPIVKLQISQEQINKIKKNQKAIITIGNKKYEGYIYKIGLKATENSGGYSSIINAEVHFVKPPARVIPGSNVSALIITGVKQNVLCLPRGSYLVTGSEHYVYKIRGNKAYKTEVNFGVITDTEAEIINGLKEGDMVIISGYQDFINLNQISLQPNGGEKID